MKPAIDRGQGAGPALIPDKLFFRIGEVADLTGVPPYVLRYWESEFKLLRPGRTTPASACTGSTRSSWSCASRRSSTRTG